MRTGEVVRLRGIRAAIIDLDGTMVDTALDFHLCKVAVITCDDDITIEHQLNPSGKARALYCDDDWLTA